jgi:hypothetical protein
MRVYQSTEYQITFVLNRLYASVFGPLINCFAVPHLSNSLPYTHLHVVRVMLYNERFITHLIFLSRMLAKVCSILLKKTNVAQLALRELLERWHLFGYEEIVEVFERNFLRSFRTFSMTTSPAKSIFDGTLAFGVTVIAVLKREHLLLSVDIEVEKRWSLKIGEG